MASSSCRSRSVALRPAEAIDTLSSLSSSSSLPPLRRRSRRVLYPASQSRIPPLKEAPDQALRCLFLLSAFVLLQICTEDTNTCTEVQIQSPEPLVSQPQDGEGSAVLVRVWTGVEDSWRVQTVGGASETQMECVVA